MQDLGDFGKRKIALGCGHAILHKGASHDPNQGRHKALSVVRKRARTAPIETVGLLYAQMGTRILIFKFRVLYTPIDCHAGYHTPGKRSTEKCR